MRTTPHYRLGFFNLGDLYTATVDLDRMVVVDNQLYALARIVGDGVLTGWTVCYAGSNEIEVHPGTGFINGVFHKTLSIKRKTVTSDVLTSVYMQSKMFSAVGGLKLETESTSSNIASATFVDTTAPSAPAAASADAVDFDTINLSWAANSENDFDHYRIRRSLTGLPGSFVTIDEPETNGVAVSDPYQDTGLSASTTYYYEIYAIDRSGNVSTATTLTETTLPDITSPAEPSGLQLFSGNTMMSVVWNESPTSGAVYKITLQGLDNDGTVLTTATYDDIDTVFYQIVGLVNSRRYRVTLQAKGTNGVLSTGMVAEATPASSAAPLDVLIDTSSVVTPQTHSIKLTWLPNTSVASGTGIGQKHQYQIRVIVNGVESAPIKNIGLALTKTIASYNETAVVGEGITKLLADDVLYTFRITTLDAVGNESVGVYVKGTTTDVTAPTDPRLFQLESGDEVITATWKHSASADVVGYVLNIDDGGGYGADIEVEYLNEYEITGLTNDTEYTVKIRAVDDAGNISSPGVTAVAIPLEDTTAPIVPISLAAIPGDQQVALTWRANEEPDLAYYVVKRVSVAETLGAMPGALLTEITEIPNAVAAGILSLVSTTLVFRSSDLIGQDVTGLILEMTGGLALGDTSEIASCNPAIGEIVLSAPLSVLPGAGDRFVIKESHESLGTVIRNVGTATEILDIELLNGQVYAYYIQSVDSRGNESEFSAPVLVAPRVGANDLNQPTNLVATYASGNVTLTWEQIVPDTIHTAIDHTAFNIYRSTEEISGFELIDSVDDDTLTYVDSNLISGETYYYIVTAVRDNADALIDTGSIEPANSVLLATVDVSDDTLAGCNIDAVENVQRIVENLEATLEEETSSRLLLHKHTVKALNGTTVQATGLIALLDASDLADISLDSFVHSPEAQRYYAGLLKDKLGNEIVYDALTTYVVSPSNVVWNVPYVGDFRVLVDGAVSDISFSIDADRNAVVFSSPIPDGSVVILDGSGYSYYVPARIDLGYRGFDIEVDDVSAEPLVDEQLQTLRFMTPLESDSVVSVTVEPVVADYGTQPGARQVSLSPNIVLSDFSTENNFTFTSDTGAFAAGDTVFVLVDNERTALSHAIDFTNKTITFDEAIPTTSTVSLEILNKEEVQGELPASRINGIDGSQFSTGEFLKEQLAPISHAGRMKELMLPKFQALTTENKYSYAAGTGVLGGSTTPYSVFQLDNGGLLLGSSNGLLKTTGFAAFLAEGEESLVGVDYSISPPPGLTFQNADADDIVEKTAAARKFGGRFNGKVTITMMVSGEPQPIKDIYSPNMLELDNGNILISGGAFFREDFATYLDSDATYIYDPVTGVMTQAGDMNQARRDHAGVLLPDGNVLICGGCRYLIVHLDPTTSTPDVEDFIRLSTTEIFDIVTNTWSNAAEMSLGRDFHTCSLLSADEVLVSGGNTGTSSYNGLFRPARITAPVPTATAEIYSISGNDWTNTASMNKARVGAESSVDNDVVIVKETGRGERELFTRETTARWVLEGGQTENEINSLREQFGLSSIDSPVKQFLEDSTGLILAVSHKNVYASDDGETFVKMKGLEAVGVVHRIAEDADGTLYAATDLGVYEITADIHDDLTWFQGGFIGQGTTETFDLQAVGTDMLAATEIGVFKAVSSGDSWTQLTDIEDVFNIELVGDILFINSGQEVYRSDDSGLTWDSVGTFTFIDENSRMIGRTPLDLFFATGTGLYVTTDGISFSLVDFDRNRKTSANNVHMVELIGTDIIAGYDNEIFAIGPAMDVQRLAEFPGTVPTVRVNEVEVRNGFRYDLEKNELVFERKRFVNDVVDATSNYGLYEAENGPWHSKNPDAAVLVFVNGKVQPDSTLEINPFLGQIAFTPDLKKTDTVTVSIAGTTLKNEGEFFHDELEDKFEKEKGLPLSMGRDYSGNILQMGLSVEHNFLERGLERNQYYCLTGVEVDRSFTSFMQNAEFYIMGRREFDRFNSTIDYVIESEQNSVGRMAMVPLSALEVSSKLWVGTENGIFVLNPSAPVPFAITSTIEVGAENNQIRDIKFFMGDLMAVTKLGLYLSEDGGITFDRNAGNGLPSDLYSLSSLGNLLLLGTGDTIYYSDGENQDPAYTTWFRATFATSLTDPTELIVNGTCSAIAVKDGTVYAGIDRSIFISTDGKKWQKVYQFEDEDIIITSMVVFARKLYVGTNMGVYNDDSSARSENASFRLELTDATTDASEELSVNDMCVSTDGSSTSLYVVGNNANVYRLANETWTTTAIPTAKAIQKFIILSSNQQIALANDSVFVQ